VISRIGCVVVFCSLVVVGGADVAAAAPSCGPGTKMTPRAELRSPLRIVDREGLIGDRTLWTVPLRAPEYGSSRKSWVLGKQAWFRLEEGPVTVTGRRVDGGSGTFHFDMPPVESYPLGLNASIGPGFIPSSLEFSSGGCWKVTARLGRSRVVLFFDIDGSKQMICAHLASSLRAAQARSEQWAHEQVDAITADQQDRRCQTAT
jgi:hypothetical protein